MTKNTLTISPGVITEHIGDDFVVMLPGSPDVLRLSGDAASAVRAIQAGGVPVLSEASVSDLVERGVLVSQAGVSRRGLIKAGAIGAGAGIAVLAMPGVAAASSLSCFTPASFSVGVGLNNSEDDPDNFWEYLTINFDREDIPVGLAETIPDGHPGTFTYSGGDPISVLWQAGNDRFATFLSPNIPLSLEDGLRLGSVSFTLSGCTYTGTGNILDR
jgi:hypothetical protein